VRLIVYVCGDAIVERCINNNSNILVENTNIIIKAFSGASLSSIEHIVAITLRYGRGEGARGFTQRHAGDVLQWALIQDMRGGLERDVVTWT
jgi:hypothetical protein